MKTDMDDDKDSAEDLVSALADGELQGDALARGLRALADDAQARQAWQAYHLIGDVLRSADLAGVTPQARFMARFSQRLAGEAVLAGRAEAANAPRGGWRWAAGLGAMAAVAAAGLWLVLPPSMPGDVGQVSAGQASAPMWRDAQLDELLVAHRQLGGASVLQAPAGGLHHVTFEPPSR